MTAPFTIVIPCSPGDLAINNAKKAVVVGGGGSGKPPRARLVEVGTSRKAKRAATTAIQSAAFDQPDEATAVSRAATIIVEIDSYWPRRRRLSGVDDLPMGDVDAPLKLTLDALEASKIIDEDARVVEVRARKFLDRDNPRIEMRVMAAPGAGQKELKLG